MPRRSSGPFAQPKHGRLAASLASHTLAYITKLTVDVEIAYAFYRMRTHMPLTVEALRIRHLNLARQLPAQEGHRVMDGLAGVLLGL
jgi:hypothetical protein